MISMEDFKKFDFRVGEIKNAVKVDKNVFRLTIDCAKEIKTFLEGDFKKEELIGRQVVVVTNLKPREVRGEKSEGMILAADVNGKPVLLMPDKKVRVGAKIR